MFSVSVYFEKRCREYSYTRLLVGDGLVTLEKILGIEWLGHRAGEDAASVNTSRTFCSHLVSLKNNNNK